MPWCTTKNVTLILVAFILAQIVFTTIFSLFGTLPQDYTLDTPATLSSAQQTQLAQMIQKEKEREKKRMELLVFLKQPLIQEPRIHLCLRQSGLAPAGGIETWFWTMANHVFM